MNRLLAAASLLALAAPAARGAGDAAFMHSLVGVRAQVAAQAKPVGWRDWFKAPEPTRVPSLQEADPAAQRVVDDGARLYFLDQGRIFERGHASGRTAHLEGSKRTAAILLYKGSLVARQQGGDLYLWNAERRQWVDLGNHAADVRAAGDDLVALTDKGALWVYKGEPGPIILTWVFIPMTSGDVTTFLMVPMYAGRRVAFFDAKVGGAAALEPAGADVVVRFKDGRRVPYAALRIVRPAD